MHVSNEDWDQIKSIVATIDCPEDFRCYKSGFKNLSPVEAFPGNDIIECRKAGDSHCSKAFRFGRSSVFCRCPVRKYAALHLGM